MDAEPAWPQIASTPALLGLLNEKLPGHQYRETVPLKVLLDPQLELKNVSELIRGSRILHAPKVEVQVNAAHRARMKQLQLSLEEKEYQDMIKQESRSSLAETQQELKMLKNQLSTVINVGISIFTAAMAAWYWTASWSTSQRVLASLLSSVALGAIETFLYFRYLAKIDMQKAYSAKTDKVSVDKKKHQ